MTVTGKPASYKWAPHASRMLKSDATLLNLNCWQYNIASRSVTSIQLIQTTLLDCSGLKDFQLQDITQIQNTRLLSIKVNLQIYNYTVKHIKGSKNHLADVFSRSPVWLNTDHTIGPDEGLDFEDGDAFAMRVMVSMPHLLRDNPLLRQLEEVAQKDKDYSAIIHAIRTGQGHKSLPHDSEGYKMGGEWSSMSIMDEAEVISVSRDDRIDRIFPP